MNPDPVAKLARFTPVSVDPAELLFAAGRASARTPWYWKAAIAASLAVNAASAGWLLFPAPEPQPVVVPAEPHAPATAPQPELPAPAPAAPDPWSYGSLHARGDLDQLPRPATFAADATSPKPLSVLSARSGEID